ncbi:RNA polymerase sigma factor, sigma-70 family [Desulfonema limicola]|uniref:RNA polymerase sigma factor, sigma-70 family n=1 Tax=Desulfonema limicola TaxID=45656 RepID=A0A975B3Z2_9BACT|nr:RNA polymerase sigma factor [Desulfonema limicola]QTA78364.1 RNA polymerase sigma factor, sigma-70 family [Desulfonema limicola]
MNGCAENIFEMKTNIKAQSDKTAKQDKNQVIKDNDLAARILEGDTWATDELIQKYQQKAFAIAYSMCGWDKEEAKDLTQEAFLKVIKNIKKFKGHSSFYTWFYRIVVNTCLDKRKKKNRWKKIFIPWGLKNQDKDDNKSPMEDMPDMREEADPMKALRGKQLNNEVQKALNSLSDKQRTAFQLKVYHEMTVPEIAKIMDMAEGTIKTHIFRATQYLRKNLQEWER